MQGRSCCFVLFYYFSPRNIMQGRSVLYSFIIFLHLFNKSFLKRQHAGNAAKCVEMDILELLKLQNILRDKPWLGQS